METAASTILPTALAPEPRRLPRGSDERLGRAAARGSDRAFAAIYERYQEPLYAYVRSLVRHDHDAQDVLQTTFANALSALRRQELRAPLRPWLYRIAHNEAISLLRRRQRHATGTLEDSRLPAASSVEAQVAQRARWTLLMDDLAELAERPREALLLRELSGLSHADIAIVLGTSVGAAKQSILEARRALGDFVEGRAMDCEAVRERLSEGDRRVLRGRRVSAHLRACASCDEFAAAIRARQADLRALSPVLPAGAGAVLLGRALGADHGVGTAGSAAARVGLAGKVAATTTTWKALTGAALIVATASGVAELRHAILPPAARHGAAVRLRSAPPIRDRADGHPPGGIVLRAVDLKAEGGSDRTRPAASALRARTGRPLPHPTGAGRHGGGPAHGIAAATTTLPLGAVAGRARSSPAAVTHRRAPADHRHGQLHATDHNETPGRGHPKSPSSAPRSRALPRPPGPQHQAGQRQREVASDSAPARALQPALQH